MVKLFHSLVCTSVLQPVWHWITFCPLEGTTEGTSSHFIYHRGIQGIIFVSLLEHPSMGGSPSNPPVALTALSLMNDIPLDSQHTEEKSQHFLQQLGVKTAREAVKMLNNFKVDALFPFLSSSSAEPPDPGL